jgi:hypothetical protein
MSRPYLLRCDTNATRPFLLSPSRAMLVADPADFTELRSRQTQRLQLLLQTLSVSHASHFNGDNGLPINLPRRHCCCSIGDGLVCNYSVTGQVGGAAARALLDARHAVRAVLRQVESGRRGRAGAEVANAEVGDTQALRAAFVDTGIHHEAGAAPQKW